MLRHVTITGADDSTDIGWMIETQKRFPFMEWGILTSPNRLGTPRYPSFVKQCDIADCSPELVLSLHVCGGYVRRICAGDWSSLHLGSLPLIKSVSRVQLNFRPYLARLGDLFYEHASKFSRFEDLPLICQIGDGMSAGGWLRLKQGFSDFAIEQADSPKVAAGIMPFYDMSGGQGISPSWWPGAPLHAYTGYAGGLGPDNVVEHLQAIEQVAEDYWVDMETRVRTDDNLSLDRAKVEAALELCQAYT
jgi:hypothetical protein